MDLTAGNGHDTLFLYRCVGREGTVLAFEVQPVALERTERRLREAGAPARVVPTEPPAPVRGPGVHLIGADHAHLEHYLEGPVRAAVANLGYLPGGDRSVATRAPATLAAVEAVLEHLMPGGRLAIVCYVGHPGGLEEARAVDRRLRALPSDEWSVIRLDAVNRPLAPFLLAAERLTGGPS